MLRTGRTTIDGADARAKLDSLVGAVKREAGDAEADPFDGAKIAAVAAEAGSLPGPEAMLGKLARKAHRSAVDRPCRDCPARIG